MAIYKNTKRRTPNARAGGTPKKRSLPRKRGPTNLGIGSYALKVVSLPRAEEFARRPKPRRLSELEKKLEPGLQNLLALHWTINADQSNKKRVSLFRVINGKREKMVYYKKE